MSTNIHPSLAAQLLGLEATSDERPAVDDAASREAQLEKLEAQAAALLRAATRQDNTASGQDTSGTEAAHEDKNG